MKHYWIGIVLFTVLVIILFSCKPYSERVLFPLQLNGTVENTYIDYGDHAIRVVVVKQEEKLIEFYVMELENPYFYKNISKGDSIIKNANTLDFYVHKKGGIIRYTFDKYP